jgi:hypothetical protein
MTSEGVEEHVVVCQTSKDRSFWHTPLTEWLQTTGLWVPDRNMATWQMTHSRACAMVRWSRSGVGALPFSPAKDVPKVREGCAGYRHGFGVRVIEVAFAGLSAGVRCAEEILTLRRSNGSLLAVFSAQGATREGVLRAAEGRAGTYGAGAYENAGLNPQGLYRALLEDVGGER